jgi:tyrosinase
VLPPDPAYFALGITGRVEIQPHDNVHDNIGGLMSNVPVAAGDPIFFVHHCQIDRLWASWQDTAEPAAYNWGNTATAPSKTVWGSQKFQFVDPAGKIVTVNALDQMSTKTLGYAYDGLAAPAPASPVVASAGPAPAALAAAAPASSGIVLAALQANQLTVGSQGGEITLKPPARSPVPAGANKLAAPAPGPTAAPTTLLLQDVRLVKRPPAPLAVFLNQPAGSAPELNSPYYVGMMNFFKWETGSTGPMPDMLGASHTAAPAGGQFRFAVADTIARQKAAGVWKDGPVTVTVSSLGADRSSGETYVTIGKVTLLP